MTDQPFEVVDPELVPEGLCEFTLTFTPDYAPAMLRYWERYAGLNPLGRVPSLTLIAAKLKEPCGKCGGIGRCSTIPITDG